MVGVGCTVGYYLMADPRESRGKTISIEILTWFQLGSSHLDNAIWTALCRLTGLSLHGGNAFTSHAADAFNWHPSLESARAFWKAAAVVFGLVVAAVAAVAAAPSS